MFKSSTLIGGKTYRLRLAANVYGYSGSFTEYEFITNLPPYGGTCGINPSSGIDQVCKRLINVLQIKLFRLVFENNSSLFKIFYLFAMIIVYFFLEKIF